MNPPSMKGQLKLIPRVATKLRPTGLAMDCERDFSRVCARLNDVLSENVRGAKKSFTSFQGLNSMKSPAKRKGTI